MYSGYEHAVVCSTQHYKLVRTVHSEHATVYSTVQSTKQQVRMVHLHLSYTNTKQNKYF